jgi:hypothetical protein
LPEEDCAGFVTQKEEKRCPLLLNKRWNVDGIFFPFF